MAMVPRPDDGHDCAANSDIKLIRPDETDFVEATVSWPDLLIPSLGCGARALQRSSTRRAKCERNTVVVTDMPCRLATIAKIVEMGHRLAHGEVELMPVQFDLEQILQQ